MLYKCNSFCYLYRVYSMAERNARNLEVKVNIITVMRVCNEDSRAPATEDWCSCNRPDAVSSVVNCLIPRKVVSFSGIFTGDSKECPGELQKGTVNII